MNKCVLDSSAILALILNEHGGEVIESMLETGLISSVNLAEVFTKLEERELLNSTTISDFGQLGFKIVDFDEKQALQAARLRPLTKYLGLSLGDRSCLALAILQNATAVTADRNWKELSVCPIEVIR